MSEEYKQQINKIYDQYVVVCAEENETPIEREDFYKNVADNMLNILTYLLSETNQGFLNTFEIGNHVMGLLSEHEKGFVIYFGASEEGKDKLRNGFREMHKKVKSENYEKLEENKEN
tara:strand:+ start:14994 stop:15344 length:351 start_codon:yes stop_codon:yes gene_type:complete